MNGCWATYSRPEDPTTVLDGIRATAPDCKVFYAKGCKVDAKEPEDYSEAMELASRSDVVIMTMGEYGWMSGEGMSRANLDIVGNQLDLFKHLQTLGKPIVVLLTNGRPLVIPYLAEHATAILETCRLCALWRSCRILPSYGCRSKAGPSGRNIRVRASL